jgi:hypothetical protein
MNPIVQKKLHDELDAYTKTKGQPTYNDLSEMKYLDMVISGMNLIESIDCTIFK